MDFLITDTRYRTVTVYVRILQNLSEYDRMYIINQERGIYMAVIFWAGIFVFFIIAEIMTVQLVSVWLAVGAFITMLSTYFIDGISFAGQLFIFIIASSLLLAVTFPLMKKYRRKGYIPTNSELDTGKQAVVIEEINTTAGTGRVTLNGIDWKAVSDEIIPINSIVRVMSVQGAKLIVELTEVKV